MSLLLDVPLPPWSVLPFAALVVAMATLPALTPRAWERPRVQVLLVIACAAPVLLLLLTSQRQHAVATALGSYASFAATLGALYVIAGGVHVEGDLLATPRVNVTFLLVGSLLGSLVGTTGASMLLIRPFLRTNRQREHRGHLVPFFILAVSNAGGLLLPLGDPPLLVGYVQGVPFFWTLRLLPAWLLYVGLFAATLYVVDKRAYAAERPSALAADRAELEPLRVTGGRNIALLLAVVPAAMLPAGSREAVLVALGVVSYVTTPRSIHAANGFSFGPVAEVLTLFAGLFLCLVPVEGLLFAKAHTLPLQQGWQLFWGAGLASAVLDNAPTYGAFMALARGLGVGRDGLVAGVSPHHLAAISIGSVVMGATTYIGNGPNLMVKAIAERVKFPVPSFLRFSLLAFVVMLPAHLVVTAALWLLAP